MRIIDAHLHMNKVEGFDELCLNNGHKNEFNHLMHSFEEQDIAGCIVMGTGRQREDPCEPGVFDLNGFEPDFEHYNYPPNVFFCIGVDPEGLKPERRKKTLAEYEKALRCPNCAGFKIYLGYRPYYAYDEIYEPVYALAEKHDMTVAFHTGDTASPTGRLRFSHPLTIDDVAVEHPSLRLVICHFGNPWMPDAAEVALKNQNVYIDLSGLAVGIPTVEQFETQFRGYLPYMETWLHYLDKWDHVLYGSDWPLVNLGAYIKVISSVIPNEHRDKVFFENALRAYPRLKTYFK